MKRRLSTPRAMGIALILATTLTLFSVFVERTGPQLVQYGNLCGVAGLEPCYKPALKRASWLRTCLRRSQKLLRLHHGSGLPTSIGTEFARAECPWMS